MNGIPEKETDGSASSLRHQVADGFLYTHSRLTADTRQALDQGSFLFALIELLAERGLVAIDDLDRRKQAVAERLSDQFSRRGIGVAFQDPEYDKYTFNGEAKIDCASRVEFCRAACCRLPFALSKQDVREGLIEWDFGQPYLIAHAPDGYCAHMDRGSCACTVRENRPVPCRGYDCSKDNRIWIDFENKQINPAILDPAWPHNVSPEAAGGTA